jgi:superfamily II DNA or RNA helicase
MKLRPWQSACKEKALRWLLETKTDRHFLVNAAPGAGKTLAACAIACELLSRDQIDRVIVIAPRSAVVGKWAEDFRMVTGRHMQKVTESDGEIAALNLDVCATWTAIQGLQDALFEVCRHSRTLVICDEHHHAAVAAAWGEGANSAFSLAQYVIVLTGTPIRSDGEASVWLAYNDSGSISHPADGAYTLTYGEAVDLGYCRPITFHRHYGQFSVSLDQSTTVSVTPTSTSVVDPRFRRIPALQRALDFYKLACTPQYESDGLTPLVSGYQGSMVTWAAAKLDEVRLQLPNAGGLVIAQSIELAEYFLKLIEKIEGERPILVHSQMQNAEQKINAFRNTDKRWLVSVAMVSEGVDIPRLRVLVYLPYALTELAFRQAMGRIVRTTGHEDDSRGYAVLPALEIFDRHAKQIETEMSPHVQSGDKTPRAKRCPNCNSQCALGSGSCEHCSYEFPDRPPRMISCGTCSAPNHPSATSCGSCGVPLVHEFGISLTEALRHGAIVRGIQLGEDEVLEGEAMAKNVRRQVLSSGDELLVQMLRSLPPESWGRLASILHR